MADIQCRNLRLNLDTVVAVRDSLTYRSMQVQLEGYRLIRTLLVECVEEIDKAVERALVEHESKKAKK